MVHEELSKEELLNEKLAYDAWVDAKYDALEDEKEEAVLCGYCKVPMDGGELVCSECFDEIFGTTSANGEGDASPPKQGTQAVGRTDDEGTQEEGVCDYRRYRAVKSGIDLTTGITRVRHEPIFFAC